VRTGYRVHLSETDRLAMLRGLPAACGATVDWVRAMFLIYLLGIVAGLAYFTVIGLTHH
jgi:hypothetical protein